MIKTKFIFWDWNGTLLDDVSICIDSMNTMLYKRGMKTIDYRYYSTVFGFPVINYYRKLGFDFTKESFEELSVEFMNEYNSRVDGITLHQSVLNTLKYFKNKGLKQVIISAMEQKMLICLLKKLRIIEYFDDIRGLNDIYAGSKVHLAQSYINENNLNPDEILLIGDTVHDAEVAKEIGCQLVLVANGHHSLERLTPHCNYVLDDLDELEKIHD